MKKEIRRESNHSWLVVWENDAAAGYAVRMITENRIPGLLPCSSRNLDDRLQLCYEITGLAPLKELFEERKLSARELLALLESLCLSLNSLEEYLLEADHLLLDPEVIYVNQDLSQISFCYVPAEEASLQEAFSALTEYFLPRLDHREPEAVTLGYGIYRYAMETEFGTDGLQRIVRELMEKNPGNQSKRKMSLEQEELWEQEEQQAEKARREEAMRAFFEEEDEKEEIPVRKKAAAAAAIFILILYLAAGGWLYAARSPWIGLWGLTAVMAALVGGTVLFFWNRKRNNEGEKPDEMAHAGSWPPQEKRRQSRQEHAGEEQPFFAEAEPFNSPEENQFGGLGGNGNCNSQESGQHTMPGIRRYPPASPEDADEQETSLLAENAAPWERYYLKEISPQPGQMFYFPDRSPFLIGKMRGTADLILPSPTVSRIHARIRVSQGKWYLKDMNSKNGTYKNGERIQGEQEMEIREGDELQFAERIYVFLREWTDIRR